MREYKTVRYNRYNRPDLTEYAGMGEILTEQAYTPISKTIKSFKTAGKIYAAAKLDAFDYEEYNET